MATDFAVAYLALPVLIGIIGLLSVLLIGSKVKPTPASFLGIGRRRTALGFLGALGVVLIFSAIESAALARTKIALAHISAADSDKYTLSWTISSFILLAPFVALVLTVLGLPALALLRRVRLASVVGALIVGQLVAALVAALAAVFPYNLWCGTHRLDCVSGVYISSAIFSAAVALGFALAARLPWLRGS